MMIAGFAAHPSTTSVVKDAQRVMKSQRHLKHSRQIPSTMITSFLAHDLQSPVVKDLKNVMKYIILLLYYNAVTENVWQIKVTL